MLRGEVGGRLPVCLPHETVAVRDALCHIARVDEVKGVLGRGFSRGRRARGLLTGLNVHSESASSISKRLFGGSACAILWGSPGRNQPVWGNPSRLDR